MFEKIGNWFVDLGEGLGKLWDSISSNVGFVMIFIGVIAAFIVLAFVAEALVCKKMKKTRNNEKLRVKRMAIIAMMSVLAIIIMLFKIPLWFLPGFYTIDASELPVIIGAFTLGPVAGVIIETLKIILNLLLNGTTTAFVGELANFLIGIAFVVPAAIIYYIKKTRKGAVIGLITGIAVNGIVGAVMNAVVLLPAYAKAFMKIEDISPLIQMGTEVNSMITDLTSFVIFAVVPFNLIKCSIVSLITILIYKRISRLLKYNDLETAAK